MRASLGADRSCGCLVGLRDAIRCSDCEHRWLVPRREALYEGGSIAPLKIPPGLDAPDTANACGPGFHYAGAAAPDKDAAVPGYPLRSLCRSRRLPGLTVYYLLAAALARRGSHGSASPGPRKSVVFAAHWVGSASKN